MSIQDQITRLNTAKTDILKSISNKGVDTSTVSTLSDVSTLIDNISTNEDLSTELNEQNTLLSNQSVTIEDIKLALQNKGSVEVVLQEKAVTPSTTQQNVIADSDYDGLSKVIVNAVDSSIDSDIKATNIRKGVDILGVIGTMEEYVEPTLQTKTATPATTAQTITPDNDYDGLSSVSISAVTSSIDSNIKAANIKSGVSILGVTGTLEEGITPSGTLDITTNGTHDVTNYASANVIVPSEDLTSEFNAYESGLALQETFIENIALALQNKTAGSGTTETWTFTMEDGSTVMKEVVVE